MLIRTFKRAQGWLSVWLVYGVIFNGLWINLANAYSNPTPYEPNSPPIPGMQNAQSYTSSSQNRVPQPGYSSINHFQNPPSVPMDDFQQMRQLIISVARTQLWVDKDLNPNYVKYAYSNGMDEAWCADFVSTILQWTVGSPWGHESRAANIYQWGQANNQLSFNPSPGDIALFRYGQSDIDHVAIVESIYPDQTFTTIGGNEGGGGMTSLGGRVKRNRFTFYDSHLVGFVNPLLNPQAIHFSTKTTGTGPTLENRLVAN